MSYKDILISKDFYCWHKCKCGGPLRERWKRKEPHALEFTIWPTKDAIETKLSKRVVCRTTLGEVENEINKYL
jgi:hypothetical protein